MQRHLIEILKRNIQFILFVLMVGLSLISTGLSIFTLFKLRNPVIIGIDPNGTRIVREHKDPIFKTEAVSFIQRFTFNVFNFDSQNFFKRLGAATTVMSDALWDKKRREIMDLRNRVERDEISLTGVIQEMTLDDKGTYHCLVSVKKKSRLNIQEHKIKIAIRLKATKRTPENPYGLEVDSYEESLIND